MPPLPIDLSPLLRGAHGHQLRVAGVAAGEPAYKVDIQALTGADGTPPGTHAIHANETIYRVTSDGAREEIPLAERVATTLQGGGFLHQGDVALSIVDGVVARIFVRGPSLRTLPILTEADIERHLGPAEGRERRYGSRRYHYPARGLVLAWVGGRTGIEHVALGADPWVEPRFGAPQLLVELLAIAAARAAGTGVWDTLRAVAAARTAGTGTWDTLLHPRAKEPRSVTYRRERVASLCLALGLGTPKAVVDGTFLSPPIHPERQRVLDEIATFSSTSGRTSASAASVTFTHLLHYRVDAERVITATAGWLACSDPTLLGMITEQNRIGSQLRALLVNVDRWLCALLDPAGRTFPLSDLIALHGWPDVDLDEMEREDRCA